MRKSNRFFIVLILTTLILISTTTVAFSIQTILKPVPKPTGDKYKQYEELKEKFAKDERFVKWQKAENDPVGSEMVYNYKTEKGRELIAYVSDEEKLISLPVYKSCMLTL